MHGCPSIIVRRRPGEIKFEAFMGVHIDMLKRCFSADFTNQKVRSRSKRRRKQQQEHGQQRQQQQKRKQPKEDPPTYHLPSAKRPPRKSSGVAGQAVACLVVHLVVMFADLPAFSRP